MAPNGFLPPFLSLSLSLSLSFSLPFYPSLPSVFFFSSFLYFIPSFLPSFLPSISSFSSLLFLFFFFLFSFSFFSFLFFFFRFFGGLHSTENPPEKAVIQWRGPSVQEKRTGKRTGKKSASFKIDNSRVVIELQPHFLTLLSTRSISLRALHQVVRFMIQWRGPRALTTSL